MLHFVDIVVLLRLSDVCLENSTPIIGDSIDFCTDSYKLLLSFNIWSKFGIVPLTMGIKKKGNFILTNTSLGVVCQVNSKSHTTNASKYVDIFGVLLYTVSFQPGLPSQSLVDISIPLVMPTISPLCLMVVSNTALKSGSSKHGKARRASVA